MLTLNQYHIHLKFLRLSLIYNVTVCYNNYFHVISDITSMLNGIPDEYILLSLLKNISDKWYDIGLSLQVHDNILDDLKKSEDNHQTKLKKIINIWKNTKPSSVTWETMIFATECAIINNKEIANNIRRYLKISKLIFLSNEVVTVNKL